MDIILFLIPSGSERKTRLLDWPTAAKLPWHALLLFGGGFALATGYKESGLSVWFGGQLSVVATLHPIIVILIVSLVITFLTELTSNTATTEMVLPVLAGLAITSGIHPLLLMIPATLSASMAFMMPVATPPNAIIFDTSRITVGQMGPDRTHPEPCRGNRHYTHDVLLGRCRVWRKRRSSGMGQITLSGKLLFGSQNPLIQTAFIIFLLSILDYSVSCSETLPETLAKFARNF